MTDSEITIRSLADTQLETYLGQMVAIYRDAFSLPPYCKGEEEVLDFERSLPRHLDKEGFRIVVALKDRTAEVIGYAYGFANTPDQFWHEEVARAVSPEVLSEWLVDSFRLVEMAVMPEVHGRGVGGLLHDHLLQGLSYKKAVLSTMAAETSAYWMYHGRGWRVLLDDFFFTGVARPYRIMGLKLGLQARA